MSTPAPTTPRYLVEKGDARLDRDQVLCMWAGNLGSADRMRVKYDWFYRGCPYREPLLRLLRESPSGALVGTASAGRRRMLLDGQEIRAGVLVDLAVLPQHRSLGPALMLQQALLDAASNELDLLYGFPNPKAAPVFKRMGYRKISEVVRHARVLRHASYLRSRLPAWLATPAGAVLDRLFAWRDLARRWPGPRIGHQWVDDPDPRMDALWSGSPKHSGLVTVRDWQFAAWRFGRSPLASTRYLLLSDQHTGTLLAWFAVQAEGSTLHVRDFWCAAAGGAIPVRFVIELIVQARKLPHNSISVEIAGCREVIDGWLEAGFVPRGSRPVFGRWSDANLDTTHQMFLTSADEDE